MITLSIASSAQNLGVSESSMPVGRPAEMATAQAGASSTGASSAGASGWAMPPAQAPGPAPDAASGGWGAPIAPAALRMGPHHRQLLLQHRLQQTLINLPPAVAAGLGYSTGSSRWFGVCLRQRRQAQLRQVLLQWIRVLSRNLSPLLNLISTSRRPSPSCFP